MSEEVKKKPLKEDPPVSGDETKTGGVEDAGEEGRQTKEPLEPEDGTGEGETPSPEGDLEEQLKNPEIKAAFDAKVQEAVDAALQQPGAMEEPEEELPLEERAAREMEAKEKGLADREKALAVREMKAAAIEELAKEQLPAALAECFSYESEEALKKSKDSVVKAFQEALKDAVNARLRRNGAPKAAEPGSAGRGKPKGSTFADIVKSQRARR